MVDAKEAARRRAVMDEAAALMAARSKETDAILRARLENAVNGAVEASRGNESMSIDEALQAIRSVGPVEDDG